MTTRNIVIVCTLLALVAGGVLLVRRASFIKSPVEMYTPNDRPAIRKLLEEDWYWLVAEGADFSADYMFEHMAPTERYSDNTLSIAVYRTPDKRVAGFVTYHLMDGFQGKIQFLAVAKEFRKKGYGRVLIKHAITELRKKGVCSIEIAVRASNHPAFNLYKSVGFKESWSTPDGFLGLNKVLCDLKSDLSPYPFGL